MVQAARSRSPGPPAELPLLARALYGAPDVPDHLLAMVPAKRVNTDPDVLWASISTLRRPDGSLASSDISMTGGARVQSSFVGQETLQVVTSHGRVDVSIQKRHGQQSVYLGDATTPIAQTTWQNAPVPVALGRTRAAFQDFSDPFSPRNDVFVDSGGGRPPSPGGLGAGGIGAAVLALLEVYNGLNEDAASLGAGEGDVAFVAFRAWAIDTKPEDERVLVPVMVGSLTDQQVREACKRLREVQEWTDAAAIGLSYLKPLISPASWGTVVHTAIKRTIDALKSAMPAEYSDVQAELSLNRQGTSDVHYSQADSIRLDVVENRIQEAGAVCFYDIKTGKRGLTTKRLQEIAEFVAAKYGAVVFYIIEVRPNN